MSLALGALVETFGGECELEGPGPLVSDVQLDSRRVSRGDLFAALPGTTSDGSRFAASAVEHGASAVLSPAALAAPVAVPNWVHPRARRVAGEAAALLQGRPSERLFTIAITGTNGKTTTAHLAGQLLEAAGRVPAVLGTAGNRLAGGVRVDATHTTPDAPSLQRLLARHAALGGDCVALEISSHALDQERDAGLVVSVAVFTGLSRDHLDYHGDMESYAAAKEKLFSGLGPDAACVVNADDPASERMARAAARAGARIVRFGTGSRVDLWASDLGTDPDGTHFVIQGMGIEKTRVSVPLVGRFNVSNVLAALAAVLLSGVSPSSALEGLATVTPARGRLEAVPTRGLPLTVRVDYAHTEDALRQVLGALRGALDARGTEGRLVCVFGCGGDRDRGKREPMGRAAGELADACILTNDNPRTEDPRAIADAVLVGLRASGCGDVRVELDRGRAIRLALEQHRPGDVVLIAGKGHESTQTVGSDELAFDDVEVAAGVLAELASGSEE